MSVTLTVTSEEDLKAQLSVALKCPLEGQTPIAEGLRQELFARGTSTRRAVCQQVQARLQPFLQIDKEITRQVLDDLERAGDIHSAPGGKIAGAPLRLVHLGGDRFAVFGCVSTPALLETFQEAEIELEGIQRWISGSTISEAFPENSSGEPTALFMPMQRWAGLNRVPACGEKWLEQITNRFASELVKPASWDRDNLDSWSAYSPDPEIAQQRRRWKRKGKEELTGQLWRTRHAGGWWLYAWTEGGAPDQEDALPLRQNEALRTSFSLDRIEEAPLRFAWTDEEEDIALEVDAFLPMAEFRLLSVSGRQARLENGSYQYRFSKETWQQLQLNLVERLGIELLQKKS